MAGVNTCYKAGQRDGIESEGKVRQRILGPGPRQPL